METGPIASFFFSWHQYDNASLEQASSNMCVEQREVLAISYIYSKTWQSNSC